MARAIHDQSRTIRVPVHVFEQASKVNGVNNMLSKEIGGKSAVIMFATRG